MLAFGQQTGVADKPGKSRDKFALYAPSVGSFVCSSAGFRASPLSAAAIFL